MFLFAKVLLFYPLEAVCQTRGSASVHVSTSRVAFSAVARARVRACVRTPVVPTSSSQRPRPRGCRGVSAPSRPRGPWRQPWGSFASPPLPRGGPAQGQKNRLRPRLLPRGRAKARGSQSPTSSRPGQALRRAVQPGAGAGWRDGRRSSVGPTDSAADFLGSLPLSRCGGLMRLPAAGPRVPPVPCTPRPHTPSPRSSLPIWASKGGGCKTLQTAGEHVRGAGPTPWGWEEARTPSIQQYPRGRR